MNVLRLTRRPFLFGQTILAAFLALSALLSISRADLMDDAFALQDAQGDALLDVLREPSASTAELAPLRAQFATQLTGEAATKFAEKADADPAISLGVAQARLQHIYALEMLQTQRAGNIEDAKAWRALIQLPKHASAVDGALALQRLGKQSQVTAMLAREYLSWQVSRIREKLDGLKRAQAAGHLNDTLLNARLAEIHELAHFPAPLLTAASQPVPTPFPAALTTREDVAARFAAWRESIESTLPNLLTEQDVARRERLVLKLLALVPKEYRNGVRDGEIVVPLEYREAQTFLVQTQQLVNELAPVWRKTRAKALAENLGPLHEQLDAAEASVNQKADLSEVERSTNAAANLCTDKLGLTLVGTGSNAVEEVALDVRTSLNSSLAAARLGRWAEAESLRLDAYATFDTAIEVRVLPRAPELAIKAERSFLDGTPQSPGIKATLDARQRGPELEQAYQQTLTHLDESIALLKVSVSPMNVALTTGTIVMREGLEAVIILAALLAGMRGVENQPQRRQIGIGVVLSIFATVVTFWLSRTVVQSLTHYGEKLEAVISVLAVIILLMVTNWVFHKVYWVQWNARLRQLRNQASGQSGERRWEWVGMVGVGFLTIYREGFETTIFLQSLLLEGGGQPVALGLAGGLLFVGFVGLGIFGIGKKLPYRKLLVFTGILIVSVLVTFLGSTVRLFQTVGWMPINPITTLEFPTWAGTWLGLYPSWEGVLIPLLGLGFVAGAWLWNKWNSKRQQAADPRPVTATAPTKPARPESRPGQPARVVYSQDRP